MKSQNENQRLLIAYAHPDDESFGMGGAIAYYVERGTEVYLICSTNGDVGTVEEEKLSGYQSISELRLEELRCAAEILGIKEVITFGYCDSGMMGSPDNANPDCLYQADEDVLVGRIVAEIRRIKPQVIITFDPYGGYGHPDHIVMYKTTTRAFHEAGDPAKYPGEPYQPAKLYYSSFPKLRLQTMIWNARLHGEDPRHMGKNKDLDLMEAMNRRLEPTTRINVAPYQPLWDKAAGCHASQMNPGQMGGLWDRLRPIIYRHQDFTLAWPAPNGRRHLERDLFEGIKISD